MAGDVNPPEQPRRPNGNGNGEPRPRVTIDSIDPTSGTPGTEVRLTGRGFGPPDSTLATVHFHLNAPDLPFVTAEIVEWTATAVRARVPGLAALGAAGRSRVTLTSDLDAFDTIGFTVLDTTPPAITSLGRASGLPGDELRIVGERFGVDGTQGRAVTFAGQAVPILSWSRGEVRVQVPPLELVGGAGDKPLQVHTPWGASGAAPFAVLEPPAVVTVTPTQGAPDTAVTIVGRGFGAFVDGVSGVVLRPEDPDVGMVGVAAAMEIASWTATEIRGFIPGFGALKISGDVQVIVRTPLAASPPAPQRFTVLDIGSVTSWTRIEPHARSDDLEAGLRAGLRAEIADPLWLLGRQWVLQELRGEDAGSPVVAQLEAESAPLWRWRTGAAGAVADLPAGVPLEVLVERESVFPARGITPTPFADQRLAVEAGLQLLHLLDRQLPAERAAIYRRRIIDQYRLTPPDDTGPSTLDLESMRFLGVVAGRVPDGSRLYADLQAALPPESGGQGTLPPELRVAERDRLAVLGAVADWFTWTETLASEPPPGQTAWEPEHLEYTFAVSAETSAGEVVLEAPEYFEGRLDWYAFVRGSGSLRPGNAAGRPEPIPISQQVVPSPVSYPGMPASRWWELEDARVDFGSIDAGPTDLLRLLFVEFATVFGNDWFVIPVDGVPVGSLSRISSLRVVDTFGEQTPVAPFTETGPDGAWRMFQPGDARDLLLLPPTLAGGLEGTALEEVVLLRDELANMAWAVERTVMSPAGRPLRRHEAYQEAQQRAEAARAGEAPLPTATLTMAYRLMSGVPDHWIPLVPGTHEGSKRLIRAAMRRPRPDGSLEPILPVGRILEPDRAALRIHDIEVPRDGVSVTRAWQVARDWAGRTHLWLGRRKHPATGEGSSGLRFDLVEPVTDPGA